MKAKIVSAIYFDLFGTELGGRPGRNDHYLYSLNSIMNIDSAEFIVYTNDKNKLDSFYSAKYPDKINKYTSIEYDLYNTPYKNKINKIKNKENTKVSDRCIELQYSKFTWLAQNNTDCDYIYWIDAGLCYSGLLPDKYLKTHTGRYYDSYYGSDIFSDTFLYNLNKFAGDKFFVCAKDNVANYWDAPLPFIYFNNGHRSDKHIIGGLFGGGSQAVAVVCDRFSHLANRVLDQERTLYSEEQILSCLFYDYHPYFIYDTFDIWWHEDNVAGAVGKKDGADLLNNNKSFYKIIEHLLFS